MIKGGVKVVYVPKPAGKTLFDMAKERGVTTLEIGVFGNSDVTDVAMAHEYGTRTVPKRSFLRDTLKLNRKKYDRILKERLPQMIKRGWVGSVAGALEGLGTIIVADVRKRILRGIEPALKPETVARKRRQGLARPKTALYATGALYNAIKARLGRK